MMNQGEYQKERAKLLKLFADADPETLELVSGLIDDAAFIKAENDDLKKSIALTGSVKIHPERPDIQKPVETARQYLKNVALYAVIIKTLNSILGGAAIEEEDEVDKFMREHKERTGQV